MKLIIKLILGILCYYLCLELLIGLFCYKLNKDLEKTIDNEIRKQASILMEKEIITQLKNETN